MRPDLCPALGGEVVIANDDVDARYECIIELAHTVGRQEEDTTVVFDAAEEDWVV